MITMYFCTAIMFFLSTNINYNVQGEDIPGRGSVRLFDNGKTGTNISGIIEIYFYDHWGPVCSPLDDRGIGVEDTVCRQLGYSGGSRWSPSIYGKPFHVAAISYVDCDSDSLNMLSCYYSIADYRECDEVNNLAVICHDEDYDHDETFPGKVRLTGFTNYSGRGLVEVHCNSQWGLVCKEGFTQNDANTICRQLGYTNATEIYSMDAISGRPIWFNEPGCNSSTQCISSCSSCPSSSLSSCSSVVGVKCSFIGDRYHYTYGKFQSCYIDDVPGKGVSSVLIGCLAGFAFCVVFVIVVSVALYCRLKLGVDCSRPKYIRI